MKIGLADFQPDGRSCNITAAVHVRL